MSVTSLKFSYFSFYKVKFISLHDGHATCKLLPPLVLAAFPVWSYFKYKAATRLSHS